VGLSPIGEEISNAVSAKPVSATHEPGAENLLLQRKRHGFLKPLENRTVASKNKPDVFTPADAAPTRRKDLL